MGLKEDLERIDSLEASEILGCSNLTLANKSSGSRLHLFSSYLEQSLILNESEVPKLYTGFEKNLGAYNDSLKVSKANYKILNRIEKFPQYPGMNYSLIVLDVENNVINIIENKRYENLAEEHGYFRPEVPVDRKCPGDIIHKDEILSKANSHDEFMNYKYGVNANVAYISRKENIEDGIIISDSFAKRVSYASIKSIEVTLGFNDILLNIYGNDYMYKCFPDLMQDVKNGIFCVKRSVDHLSSGCNTTVNSLMNIDTNDEIYHGDGKLLDVEIFINSNEELYKDNGHRSQILGYYNTIKDYKTNIVNALEPYIKNHGVKLTTEAFTKYYNYKNYVDICNSPNNDIRFSNSTGTFEFAFVRFIIGRNSNLTEGSKLSNRFGGKGVVCRVVPEAMMPIDEYGQRVEVIFNPVGVIGRSNSGQLYEQELNFIASVLEIRIGKTESITEKYSILSKYFKIVDEDSSKLFETYYKSLSAPMKKKCMDDIVSNGIHIRQHPFNNISFENLKKLYIDFDIKPSKLSIFYKMNNGTIREYKSVNPVVVGKEYILVLKHTTDSKFSSISISDVNSLGLPFKNSLKSKNAAFRGTAVKFGEMENTIALNRIDPRIMNRFLAGNGSNLKHRDLVAKQLLEKDPFMYHNIPISSDDIKDSIGSDAMIAILMQMGFSIYADKSKQTIMVGRPPTK